MARFVSQMPSETHELSAAAALTYRSVFPADSLISLVRETFVCQLPSSAWTS
jgi:hypothetical protein